MLTLIAVADTSSKSATTFIDGLMFYALITCVLAIFISGALWAVGSRGQNEGQELTGKRGLIVSLTAAVLIGALPVIMTFVTTVSNNSNNADISVTPVGCSGATCTLVQNGNYGGN